MAQNVILAFSGGVPPPQSACSRLDIQRWKTFVPKYLTNKTTLELLPVSLNNQEVLQNEFGVFSLRSFVKVLIFSFPVHATLSFDFERLYI